MDANEVAEVIERMDSENPTFAEMTTELIRHYGGDILTVKGAQVLVVDYAFALQFEQ